MHVYNLCYSIKYVLRNEISFVCIPFRRNLHISNVFPRTNRHLPQYSRCVSLCWDVVTCWPSQLYWCYGLIGTRRNRVAFTVVCPVTRSKHVFFHYICAGSSGAHRSVQGWTLSTLYCEWLFIVCRTRPASIVAVSDDIFKLMHIVAQFWGDSTQLDSIWLKECRRLLSATGYNMKAMNTSPSFYLFWWLNVVLVECCFFTWLWICIFCIYSTYTTLMGICNFVVLLIQWQ